MIRRSFRAGILLGVLAGAAGALKKVLDAKRTPSPASPGTGAWPPLPDAEPVIVPPAPAPEQSRVVPDAAPSTEVHDGDRAEGHFADTDRQPDVPTPDWNPADLQEGPASRAPAGPAKKAGGPSKKSASPAKKKAAPWVDPKADGSCPGTHPVKAKLTSKIFHLPGGLSYTRTQPDRCYVDAASAEADGLRAAKR